MMLGSGCCERCGVQNQLRCVELLLQANASVENTDNKGMNALATAGK